MSTGGTDLAATMLERAMPTFVLFSHDGYGLGHVRRNTLIARALLQLEPRARIHVVTGAPWRLAWLDDPRFSVVRVPSLVKDEDGVYRSDGLTFDEALERRAARFEQLVAESRPDVVLVDRHPFGTAGELRPGLERARRNGAVALLGLRDILDDPATVAAELAGEGWAAAAETYDEALVYGEPVLCDHEREYGIPLPLSYCGWVTPAVSPRPVDPSLVAVASGGGADAADVFRLGVEVLLARPERRAIVVAGPYSHRGMLLEGRLRLGRRVAIRREDDGCAGLFAEAGVVLQMGGYNTTFEAFAAGARPIVLPRRAPRREQVIRASRLAALGLADVVDAGVGGTEVSWLLDQPRRLDHGALDRAGISLDGAARAAGKVLQAAGVRAR